MRPIDKVLSKFGECGLRRSGDDGDQWVALCPAHEDTRHSLTIGMGTDGRVVLTCFAGCPTDRVIRAVGLEWGDLFEEREVLTLHQLAAAKRLPVEWLSSQCGLRDLDHGRGVGIPYQNEARKTLFTRRRVQMRSRTLQPKGQKLAAYGQWRLQEARSAGRLVLVEGESDCWTLWFHGFPAMGLPGSSTAKTLEAEYLRGIGTVHVWQEPGPSGQAFADKVSRRLRSLEYAGQAKLIRSETAKDPSALHILDPDGFPSAFRAILDAAPDLPPPGAHQGKGGMPGQIAAMAATVTAGKDTGAPLIPGPSPGYFGLTDLGNANRLVFLYGQDIRYCHPWGKWMIWRGSCWREDVTGEIWRRMAHTIRCIYSEALAASGDLREDLIEHASDSESGARIRSAVDLARSLTPVPVSPEEFDANPWLFNATNATIDLRTGQAREPDRADLITKCSQAAHDPDAVCPAWLAFLDRIMGGKADLVEFLRLAVGYSLTADVGEKCFFFLHGGGDNGKSSFTEILMELLGDYAAKMNVEAILAKYGSASGIPNDIARLAGVRLVSTAELPEGRRLDEARIKDLTGKDTISARFMRGEWFDFRAVFKMWMYGNHKPVIRGADDGIWRRVRLIPFAVTIPKAEQDPALGAKLSKELPGILNWAISGCLDWRRAGGLPCPKAITDAVSEYRIEMDTLGEFIRERCLVSNASGVTVPVAELYRSFADWAKGRGEYVDSQRVFGSKIKARGFAQGKATAGVRVWHGLGLLAQPGERDETANGHADNGKLDDWLSELDR